MASAIGTMDDSTAQTAVICHCGMPATWVNAMLWLALTPERLTNSQPPPSASTSASDRASARFSDTSSACSRPGRKRLNSNARPTAPTKAVAANCAGRKGVNHRGRARTTITSMPVYRPTTNAASKVKAAAVTMALRDAAPPRPARRYRKARRSWPCPRVAKSTRSASHAYSIRQPRYRGMKNEPHDIHDCGWK